MSYSSSVTSDGSFEIVSVVNEFPQDWDTAIYKPMATFHDVFDVYPMDTDIITRISFDEKFKRSPSDKVIVLPICWKTTEQALCAVNIIGNYVRFDVNDLPKSCAEDKFYQLCYCSENEKVVGVSIPFSFREVHEDELMEYQKEQNKEFWTFRSRFAVLMDVYWNSLDKKLSKETINSNSNCTDGTFETPTQSDTEIKQNIVSVKETDENQDDIEKTVEVDNNDVKKEEATMSPNLVKKEEADMSQNLVKKEEAEVNQDLVKEEGVDTNQQIQSKENVEKKENSNELVRKLEILDRKRQVRIEEQKELRKLCKIYVEEIKQLLSFFKRFHESSQHFYTKPALEWWDLSMKQMDDIHREENPATETFELKALVEREKIRKTKFCALMRNLNKNLRKDVTWTDFLIKQEIEKLQRNISDIQANAVGNYEETEQFRNLYIATRRRQLGVVEDPNEKKENQESQATQTCESVLHTLITKEDLHRLKQEESRIYHENKNKGLLKDDELFNPSNLISDSNYNKMMESLMLCGYLTRSGRLWDNINEMFTKFHKEFEQLRSDKESLCREIARLYQTNEATEEANKALLTRLSNGAKEYAKLMLKHQELIKIYGYLKKETN